MRPEQYRYGRRKPYTEAGIRRLPCCRCGAQAEFQWSACADGNLWRPLCKPCDVGLNRVALEYIGDPRAASKIRAYAKRVGVAP